MKNEIKLLESKKKSQRKIKKKREEKLKNKRK